MQSLKDLKLEAFLPLSRMRELEDSARARYSTAKPFAHIYFDNFFDPGLVDAVLDEFPGPDAIKWQRFDNEREIKLASAKEASFGPATRLLLYHLNSMTFLEFLSKVTGIENLIDRKSVV